MVVIDSDVSRSA